LNSNFESVFYNGVTVICALMTVVNLARQKSRGLSAVFLGLAFLIMGVSVFAYTRHLPSFIVWVGGVAVFLLLAADVGYRSIRGTQKVQPRQGRK
jgi:hypothetical protein